MLPAIYAPPEVEIMKIPENLKWKPTGKTLGGGGQAEVYEVIDKENSDSLPRALKALAKGKPKQAYDRFYREISAIRQLDHPNIIKILDNSEANADFHYYVMEAPKGASSLKHLMDSKASPYWGEPLKCLDLFTQIIKVVHYCAKLDDPIVHRDLSPANILVLPDGTAKIIDFGLCQIEGGTPITLADEGVGTVNYMAPECESGSEKDISARSDIYSAGKILWSAITNQRAFSRENPAFTSKSMPELFPDSPEIWHMQILFQATVRKSPENRAGPVYLRFMAKQIAASIRSGRPPLELMLERCPICCIGDLRGFEGSHMVFGNPPPQGIVALQCSYCGYCFAINQKAIREALQMRRTLD